MSAHRLAASPGAHRLEYVDWTGALLVEPLRIVEGMAYPSSAPGNGLAWDDAVVLRLAAG